MTRCRDILVFSVLDIKKHAELEAKPCQVVVKYPISDFHFPMPGIFMSVSNVRLPVVHCP